MVGCQVCQVGQMASSDVCQVILFSKKTSLNFFDILIVLFFTPRGLFWTCASFLDSLSFWRIVQKFRTDPLLNCIGTHWVLHRQCSLRRLYYSSNLTSSIIIEIATSDLEMSQWMSLESQRWCSYPNATKWQGWNLNSGSLFQGSQRRAV